MTAITEAIAGLNEMNAYQLASMADTHSPDSLESEGAAFLTSVRDSVVEQVERVAETYPDFDGSVIGDTLENDGSIHEIADGAPSIYTHRKFQQLLDLCAYQEDVSEYGDADMETMAGYALYMVAERLVKALLDYVAEFESEEVDADSL